ncbi:hypothetical protein C1H46_020289 [Malus baccata]|uniref:Uncharacterized protein n=1 Tax=Malus baccata TaxID=106549 RepID=A0A540M5S0_MALBA|nr:hypothetical protein C1H46_020289 [Malus baccata]
MLKSEWSQKPSIVVQFLCNIVQNTWGHISSSEKMKEQIFFLADLDKIVEH